MKTIEAKYGIFPEDKPSRKTDNVYYYDTIYNYWEETSSDELEDGEAWSYSNLGNLKPEFPKSWKTATDDVLARAAIDSGVLSGVHWEEMIDSTVKEVIISSLECHNIDPNKY